MSSALTGKELPVPLEATWSVLQLKEALQEASGVPVAQQRLLYGPTLLRSGPAEQLLRGLGASGTVALQLLRVESARDLPGQHLGSNCLCRPQDGEVCHSTEGDRLREPARSFRIINVLNVVSPRLGLQRFSAPQLFFPNLDVEGIFV